MPTARTHAALQIFHRSEEGSAAAITTALGLEPSSSHEAGDPRSEWDRWPWPNAMWSLESGLPWERPLDAHRTQLCNAVESKRHELLDLAAAGYSLDWFCFVEVLNGQGGVALGVDLLRRLGRIARETRSRHLRGDE
jgi:hypothetical protein